MQTKLHQLKNIYAQYEKGSIDGKQFKDKLQKDMHLRWNDNLENISHRIHPSYTDFVKAVNKTNKYVPKKQEMIEEPIKVPKKIRREHEGHGNIITMAYEQQ